MIGRRSALVALIGAAAAAAEPPAAVAALFRDAAGALAGQDATAFLDLFDRAMPGYAQFRVDVEGLLARGWVASTIEFVADEGDDRQRALEVDWLWRLSGGAPHRAIVKCRVERRGQIGRAHV